ncbi:MAG: hypothetical protein IKS17_06280 [Firmicutes bacterium]|nr:hypothetical protein [Bacillota bacterium]
MKRIFAFITAACLLMTTACSSTPEPSAEQTTAAETQTETTTETAVGGVQTLDQAVTVFDGSEYSLKITACDTSKITEPTLITHAENKSSKKTYVFYAETSYIDSIDAPTLWMQETEPNKSEDGSIGFYMDELEKLGVTKITDIELTVGVYEDSIDNEPLEKTTVHVYPEGEENAAPFVHTPADGEKVLVDMPEAKATVIDCGMDDIGEYSVWLYLENRTEHEVMFTSEDEYLNGRKAADPSFSWAVAPKRSSYTRITWYEDELKNANIEDVNEISLVLRVYDNEDLDKPDYVKSEVTIIPQNS